MLTQRHKYFTKLSFRERIIRSLLCYTNGVFSERMRVMKRRFTILLTIILAMALAFSGCGGKGESSDDKSGDSGSKGEKKTEAANVVKTFDEIDTEDMNDEPLQLESVTLYDDGTVKVVPLDKVKEIAETNDELTDGAAYPFKDAGKVKDIYLVRFGNGGFRTIIALMDDGTLSALSAKDLIEEHILVVMPNMTGRDNYVSIEQREDEDGFGVVGITENDEEIELDMSLDF